MKISRETVAVLQNFASINSGLLVEKGNTLKTISPQKTILAEATVTEDFDDFCIYDLSQFLGTLSLFEDPDLEFDDKYVAITNGNSRVKYIFADPETVVTVPKQKLDVASDIELVITKDNFEKASKAANVLGLQYIVFESDGESVVLKATDVKSSTSNEIAVEVDPDSVKTLPDHGFSMVFKMDNLKIIPDDYVVVISGQGIAEFTGSIAKYFVTVEQTDSKFNN